jgi:hypothetical protein
VLSASLFFFFVFFQAFWLFSYYCFLCLLVGTIDEEDARPNVKNAEVARYLENEVDSGNDSEQPDTRAFKVCF